MAKEVKDVTENVEETVEKEEDFLDEKPKKEDKKPKKEKEYKEKSMFSRIMNVVLWIILLSWMAVCLFDFYRVHKERDPFFCIDKGVTEYDDGDVKWCLGLGYKVYNYQRRSFTAIEFGPFWSEDRSESAKN